MKINALTPYLFVKSCLDAVQGVKIDAPTISSITDKLFVISDDRNRGNFIKGNKLDIGFLNGGDLSYMRNTEVMETELEEIPHGTLFGNSVLTDDETAQTDNFNDLAFTAFRNVLCTELLERQHVLICSFDHVVTVKVINSP